jgi:hypothetical protein
MHARYVFVDTVGSMRGAGMVLGLLAVLLAGYLVYQGSASRPDADVAPVPEQVDIVGIRTDLLMMAQAEQQYLAMHSTYATLDELEERGLLPRPKEARGYVFSATPQGDQSFTITAAPADPQKAGWPIFTVDETMQVLRR